MHLGPIISLKEYFFRLKNAGVVYVTSLDIFRHFLRGNLFNIKKHFNEILICKRNAKQLMRLLSIIVLFTYAIDSPGNYLVHTV